jgi:diacylglycerol kinase (ATP)
MKPGILFIINPIAGHKKGPALQKLVESSALSEKYNVQVATTERRGHAIELSAKAAEEGYYCVIAVGGDGTVNETARALTGTETALAIIPAGSGNGLARHLHFSANPAEALYRIINGKKTAIDTLMINDRLSLNVSGFGFDGYVAWLFDKSGKRGLNNYTSIALKEYLRYKAIDFKIELDNTSIGERAHMVVIANASQFGNAAVIAPDADLKDGLMDVIIVKKPPIHLMPSLFYKLFTGKLKSDQYTSMYKCKTLTAAVSHPVHLHIDGEPNEPVQKIITEIKPLSLKVIS